MLVPCEVLRPFHFSEDGVNARPANAGDEAHIPHDLVPGLTQEGYVKPKALGAPENKAIQSAPENKRSVAKGPGGRWFVMEDGQRVSSGFATEEEAAEAL